MTKTINWIVILICVGFISCSNSKNIQKRITVNFGKFYSDSISYLPYLRIVEKVGQSNNPSLISADSGWDKWKLELFDEVIKSDFGLNRKKNNIVFLHKYKDSTHWFKFDTNSDRDFSDEKEYQLSRRADFVSIRNIQFVFGGNEIFDSIFVKPVQTRPMPGLKRKPSSESDEFDVAMLPLVRYAEFNTGRGQGYKVALSNNLENSFTKRNAIILIVPSLNAFPDKRSFPVKYRVNDTVYLGKRVYKFTDLDSSGDHIELAHIATLKRDFGVSVGDYILNFKATNFNNGRGVLIGPSSKFTLLDFWGTWCKPCIELTDSLKKIYATFDKMKLDLISVAYDKSVEIARNYTNSKGMEWPNVFDDMNNSLICSKYKIDAFPTFILLDQFGKILFRGSGKLALESIEKILKERL